MEEAKKIEEEIKKEYPDANDFTYTRLGQGSLLNGYAYYVEFKSNQLKKGDSWYYAYTRGNECYLFDNEIDIADYVIGQVERSRSVWQTIVGSSLADIVASLIAIILVTSFVVLMIVNNGQVNKDILSVITLVLGYYFGRQVRG